MSSSFEIPLEGGSPLPVGPAPETETTAPAAPQQVDLTGLVASINALKDMLTPKLLFSLFKESISASAQITPFLTPSQAPCKVKIYAVFDTAGNLNVVRFRPNQQLSSTVTEQMNAVLGNLNANGGYSFEIQVDPFEQFYLTYSVSAIALKLSIWEVDAVTG